MPGILNLEKVVSESVGKDNNNYCYYCLRSKLINDKLFRAGAGKPT